MPVTHGKSRTVEYRAWVHMRERCSNPNTQHFDRYGGRGISVCERWDSFENFYADMGPRPQGMSIERIDVNGNYCPENCKWATKVEQMSNTRRSRLFTFYGKTLTLSAWARISQVDKGVILCRLKKGMPEREAVWAQPTARHSRRGRKKAVKA